MNDATAKNMWSTHPGLMGQPQPQSSKVRSLTHIERSNKEKPDIPLKIFFGSSEIVVERVTSCDSDIWKAQHPAACTPFSKDPVSPDSPRMFVPLSLSLRFEKFADLIAQSVFTPGNGIGFDFHSLRNLIRSQPLAYKL